MANWIKVGAADMLPDGAMQEIQAGDQAVLLARVGETYYATQARCPHLRARLAKGTLDGKGDQKYDPGVGRAQRPEHISG